MTNEKAIDLIVKLQNQIYKGHYGDIEYHEEYGNDEDSYYYVLEKAYEALEKQIPKKPIWETVGGHNAYYCPCCESAYVMYSSEEGITYCHNCGQASGHYKLEHI